MNERRLGRSEIMASPMGLGGLAIGGPFRRTDFDSIPWQTDRSKPFPGGWGPIDDAESIRAIRAGLDHGITLIDTSSSYGCGHSERVIGEAIAGRRHDVVLVTKFGNLIDERAKIYLGHDASPASIRASCEASLSRLGTDYIDVFLLHWSGFDADPAPIAIVLNDLVQVGKIRTYGWSTHAAERLDGFAKHSHFSVVEFPHSILQRSPAMLGRCEEDDLGALIRSPLGMGILTGTLSADTAFPPTDIRRGWNLRDGQHARMLQAVERMRDVLTSRGRTPSQGALAWIWAQSNRTVPIPGFRTEGQVLENAKAMEMGPLSPTEVREIDELLDSLTQT